jgi:hypothetical protein
VPCVDGEQAPRLSASDLQLVLQSIYTSLQLVEGHTGSRDVKDALVVRNGPGEGQRDARRHSRGFWFNV